jgi:hypothetical protein
LGFGLGGSSRGTDRTFAGWLHRVIAERQNIRIAGLPFHTLGNGSD